VPTIHPPPKDIVLEPHDWYLASWRNLPPLPKPQPAPFDRAACLRRLRKVKVLQSGLWSWTAAKIQPSLSPEEATFWLATFQHADDAGKTPNDLVDDPPVAPVATAPADLTTWIRQARKGRTAEVLPVLAALLDARALAEVLVPLAEGEAVVLPAFRRYVRPYLDEAQRQVMCEVVGGAIIALLDARIKVAILPVCIAASLGMNDVIARILERPGGTNVNYHSEHRPFLALGLADRARVRQMVENDHCPVTSEYVRGIIAHLESDAVEALEKRSRWADRATAERFLTELGRIHRPALAPFMLRRQTGKRPSAAAQAWLDTHRDVALEGLLPLVGNEELREGILSYLRGLIRLGESDLVDRHVDGLAPDLADRVREALHSTIAGRHVEEGGRPDWFPFIADAVRLPRWLDPTTLPPILIAGEPLPSSCVPTVLAALRDSTLAAPAALVPLLKQHAEPRSLDAFAVALFDRWQTASGKFEEIWAMIALGLLGGDQACLRLEELMPSLPQQRAQVARNCLCAIDRPQALTSMLNLTRSGHLPASPVWQIASSRNLTIDELTDTAVPTLRLEGEPAVNLGGSAGRRFRLLLAPDLKPCLLDSKHERHLDFPPMEDGDDPIKVDLARAEWDVFSSRALQVIPAETLRLEMAMRYQRRWSLPFFRDVVAKHGLLGYLIRPLVWGLFVEDGRQFAVAFRVAPGGGLVDIAGRPVAEEEGGDAMTVGLVHPTTLANDERLIWGDVLADNDLTPPFVQLAREVHSVEEDEQKRTVCERVAGRAVAGKRIAKFFRLHGWEGSRYMTSHVWKYFPLARQFACIVFSKELWLEYSDHNQEQVEVKCGYVTHPTKKSHIPFSHGAKYRIKLGEADPQVFDEMLRVIHEFSS
jgi:hypothetical protein